MSVTPRATIWSPLRAELARVWSTFVSEGPPDAWRILTNAGFAVRSLKAPRAGSALGTRARLTVIDLRVRGAVGALPRPVSVRITDDGFSVWRSFRSHSALHFPWSSVTVRDDADARRARGVTFEIVALDVSVLMTLGGRALENDLRACLSAFDIRAGLANAPYR